MNWRVAEALLTLRDQVNKAYPHRNKDSDGTIGDAAHASRNSDHNPWVKDSNGQPVVTGMDITHDPVNGIDAAKFADRLRLNRDPRLKYVISNRRIASFDHGWAWRPYNGINAHEHHCHISVRDSQALYDSKKPWAGIEIESMSKSKIGNAQIAQAVAVTTSVGGPLAANLFTSDNIQTVSNIADASGNVVAQTQTIVKTVPIGFWHSALAFVSSPKFLAVALVVSLALCGVSWYYRWQMKKDGLA